MATRKSLSKCHSGLAPFAQTRFKILPNPKQWDASREPLTLHPIANNTAIDIPVAADKTFTLPRIQQAIVGKTICGEAKIEIRGTQFPDTERYFSKVIITAKSKTESIRLVFSRAEYFHAACITGKNNHPYLVFQNYCGGSGCHDLDNYGIIDTQSMEALLVPDDDNRSRASQILGKQVPELLGDKGRFF